MNKKMLTGCFAFALVAQLASAQVKVTGRVVSADDGQPIVGASIIVEGTRVGTISSADGSFTLNNVQDGKKLKVSYLGMTPQVVVVGPNLQIALKGDSRALNEVVVTAQGLTRQKRSLGYAAQEIKADELTTVHETNLNNALAGKIAGARFVGGSSTKFDEGSIVLRGVTSLTDQAGAAPIYVVDGVITSASAVNMDDVASLNVLKGPAATALYGVQGGNGAIIITTKGFAAGKSHQEINVSHTLTWDLAYNHVKLQKEYGGGYLGGNAEDLPVYTWKEGDPEDFKALDGMHYYDYADDASWGPKFDPNVQVLPAVAWDKTSPYFGKTQAWVNRLDLKDFYHTGITNTTNVSFAKSGKDYSTRISFSNVNIKGITPNSDAQRRFASIKSTFTPMKNLRVTASYFYTYKKNHNAAEEEYGGSNPMADYLQWGHTNVDLKQYKDYKRPDGSFRTWNINQANGVMSDFTAAYHESPFTLYNENNRTVVTQYHVISGDAEYSLPYNLKLGFKVMDNIYTYYADKKAPKTIGITPVYQQWQTQRSDLYLQGRLTWDDRFLENRLALNAAAFVEERIYHRESNNVFTRDGMMSDGFWNVSNSVGLSGGANTSTRQKTQSIFGTASAGWDDTYYAEFSLRNDWNSTLPTDDNSYLYGGVSASVIASNWFQDADWLSFWKLRASMAQVGSSLNPYRLSSTYRFSKRYGSVSTMYGYPVLIDKDIKPAITTSYEIGTEFSLFRHRVWGDINYYRRDTKNQIINVTTSAFSGYSSQLTNAGLIRNEGWEISLGFTPVKTKDFQWDVEGNFARNRNKLVSLTDGMNRYRLWGFSFVDYVYNYAEVGKPMGELYTSRNLATDPQGRLILKEQTNPETIATYGKYTPVVDTSTEKDLGSIQPDFTGGFSTTLKYKNLTLHASFDYQVGGKLVSITNMWGEGSGLFASTAGKNDKGGDVRGSLSENGGVRLDGVVSDGKGGYTPVTSYVDANYYFQSVKSYLWAPYTYDATYVKMRELSLTYALPKAWISHLGITAASVSFIATNPWLVYSKVPNIDPSEAGPVANMDPTLGTSSYGGLEQAQSMSSRSFGLSINLTF